MFTRASCLAIIFICGLSPCECVHLLDDDFLLVTDSAAGAIYQISRSGDHVTQLELNMTSAVPVAVDYDPEDKRVYWSDLNGHAILSSRLDGSEYKVVVQRTPKASPEGVAVDPVADLLFYTDQGEDSINVARRDGTDRKTIITDVQNPRTIRLDPRHRQIYWADWGRNTIERASYDGSSRQVLYKTASSWINGLELDLNSRHVYWVDAYSDLVQRADMDGGSNLMIVLDANTTQPTAYNGTANPHFYGLTLDDDYIYVTDWDRKGVFFARKDGSEFTYLHGPFLVASGIIAYRSSWYTKGHPSHCNDALDRNAGCSNLCIPTSDSIVCVCPQGQRLSVDGKNCLTDIVALGPDVIWLEHDSLSTSYIMGMHGEPDVYLGQRKFGQRWSIRSPLWHWTAVDNDYRTNTLYMADREDNLIVQLSMTSNLTIDVVHYGTSSQVNGIAVDWVSRNVYWTDALFNWIQMAKAVKKTPVTRTVISVDLEEPHGIAVWPQKGMLLWTDWGSTDKIEASTLSGSDRRILVQTNLNNPTSITIDYLTEKVYWCNRDSVEEMNADGSDRRSLGQFSAANFVDLTHYDNFIFAIDKNSASSSFKLWILNAQDPERLYPRLLLQRAPYGITMLSKAKQEHTTSVCEKSNCSQLCMVTADQTAQCVCGDGYDLHEDRITCVENKQTFTGPAIIYSLGDRLCAVSIQNAMGSVSNPDQNCFFVDARYSFRALDYHYSTGNIYFSEVKYHVHSIRIAHMKNMTDNMAIVQGTGQIKGLVVDYSAGNLYWTDYTHGQIWISRLDGSLQKILVTGLRNPIGIAIDQLNKKLYWSEQGNDTDTENIILGSLKQSDMDGGNIRKLDIAVQKPAGITLDPISGRLYWVDQAKATIEHIRPDSLVAHTTVDLPGDDINRQLYDVAVFQDVLAYSQWGPNNRSGVHVMEAGSTQGSTQGSTEGSTQEIQSNLLHRLHETAYDVIVFSSQNQANLYPGDGARSCMYDNGGCDQLCVQKTDDVTCLCVDGMKLDGDECVPNVLRNDNFFLIADDYRYQIYQSGSNLSDEVISAFVMPPGDRPIALTYDFKHEKVYWTDFNAAVIKSSHLNGSDAQIVFVGGVSSRIDGLAFDHESRVLYYTDTGLDYIGVLSPTGEHHKVIVKEDLSSPRAIVLDPKNGYMYYTVRSTSNGRIERRDLSGKNPYVLISTELSWPNGLDIDFEEGRMYWVDSHSETIESASLLGADRKLVYSDTRESDPFGLAVQAEYIYWTDWTFRGVFRVNKNGGNVTSYFGDLFRGLNDIRFFNKTALRGPNACSDNIGGCSHFCLAAPGGERVCDCPTGYKLDTDGATCIDVPTCPQDIPNGQIDPACSREFDSLCSFACHNGYTKTRREGLKCGEDMTWETDQDRACSYSVCPLLSIPADATLEPGCPLVGTPGTSCVHQCRYGYTQAAGDTRRNCTENKTWTGTDISCIPVKKCPALNISTSVIAYPSTCRVQDAAAGQVCELVCTSGWLPSDDTPGGTVIMCTELSVWNDTGITCTQVVQANTTGLTTPIIIGIAVACISLVVIVILVAVLLIRKRNKKFARYRDSSNIQHETTTTPSNGFHYGQEVNGNSPTYDARTDSVDLSFDNKAYTPLQHEGASVSSASTLQKAELIIADNNSKTDIPDTMSFDNPLYTKEQQQKEHVTEVDKQLQGSRVQPDLTRELSSV